MFLNKKTLMLCAMLLALNAMNILAQNWKVQTSGTAASLRGVYFTDVNHGWSVGAGGALLKTNDGGSSWISQTSGTTNDLNSVCFTSASMGWIAGNASTILKTTNGGTSWTLQTIGTPTSYPNLYSVRFIDANHGWVAGAFIILTTVDGGASWSQTSATSVLNSTYFIDSSNGWVAGYYGDLQNTINGGAAWNLQSSGTTSPLNSVFFTDVNTGRVVGNGGVILNTTNGGLVWNPQVSGATKDLNSVFFTNANTGWVAGNEGTLLKTMDGGTNWILQARKTTLSLYSLHFIDANNGWAVGDSGIVLKYTNDVNAPPSNLSYPSNAVVYTTGIAISANMPDYSGAGVTFTVSPSLPAGLILNSSTGILSGTPIISSSAANYIITTTNSHGATSTTMNITVLPSPSSLSYSRNPATYYQGVVIYPNSPHVTGTVTAYSVTPALPAGLSLDVNTGVISGTPQAISPPTNYIITASNAYGATAANVLISVQLLQNLYPPLSRVLCINQSSGFTYTNAVNALTAILRDMAAQKDFTLVVPSSVAATQAQMNDDSLSTYQVVIFNNNSFIGRVITDPAQRTAFQRWLKRGGGLVGWHGVMDHGDLWPFLADSVFSGTKFTEWSAWNSTGGRNAQVQVDTVSTSGIIRSQKPEYTDLLASFPKTHWTWPDSWMSFRTNPRSKVDVLLTIDENTYDVPAATKMGDHPIAWTYTLPPDSGGKQGRFIYNARGYEASAFTGTGANAAPNGIDTGETGLAKTWIWQSIRWAAGLTQTSVAVRSVAGDNREGSLNVSHQNGALQISVYGMKKYVVEVFDLSGHRLGRQTGEGDREYSFTTLKSNAVYLIRVKSDKQTYVQRIAY